MLSSTKTVWLLPGARLLEQIVVDGITRAVTTVAVQAGAAWFASLFGEKDSWAFRLSRRVLVSRRPVNTKDDAWLLQGLRYTVHVLFTGKKKGPALHGIDVLMKGIPTDAGNREYFLKTFAYVPSQDHGDRIQKAGDMYKRFEGHQNTQGMASTALAHMLTLESHIRNPSDPWLIQPNTPLEISGYATLLKETVVDFAQLHDSNITIELYGTFSTMEKDDKPSRVRMGELTFTPCQLCGGHDGDDDFTCTADDPYVVPVTL